jgi:hypothetical protein
MLFSTSLYLAQIIWDYRSDQFSCSGRIDFTDKKRNYTVQVKYIFNRGKGEVATIGEYNEVGQNSQRLIQQLSFDYTRNGRELVMLSTSSSLSDEQARMLNTLVPDFYLYKDRGFRIQIYRQGEFGYVFTTYGVPVFICSKI